MEDILKELGTWAAENLDAIPQKFREALATAAEAIARAGRFIYESDAISSRAESSYNGKPGKSLMDIVGTYLNCTDR